MDEDGIRDFKPPLGFKDTWFRSSGSIMGALHHTYTRNIEEVETYFRYSFTLIVVIKKRIVRLVIAIKVSTHKSYWFPNAYNGILSSLVIVTHQHDGIIIHCVRGIAA